MRRIRTMLIWAFAFGCLAPFAQGQQREKKMAVTFDEVPMAETFVEINGASLTRRILEALRKVEAPATGFVVGDKVAPNADLIGEWLNAGHTLGTMTLSNQDFTEVSVGEFMRQVKMGDEALEPILSRFGQKKRYFRFPFLHYGPTRTAKAKARQLIEAKGTIIAHVTVISDDYLYNLRLEKLGKHTDSARVLSLMNEYINHVLDELTRQEQLALQVAGKPVVQILQLRANWLNALFGWELLNAIKNEGYKFVTLNAALADPAYTITERYDGNRGVGYLDMVELSKKKKK
ncbi:MAG: polysaccharide deacetylase family protein [candidate division Zixibacteria bacterium]|nr:polysaccharide deacetylase family protein [candidate division Zixibacteria bacterium]